MSMFCYQCQETGRGVGCEVSGVCGKNDKVASAQDELILKLKKIGFYAVQKRSAGEAVLNAIDLFLIEGLFTTITNVNFDEERIRQLILQGDKIIDQLKGGGILPKDRSPGVLAEANEDVRSLKELILYGLKGIAAYADHAYVLDYKDEQIFVLSSKPWEIY